MRSLMAPVPSPGRYLLQHGPLSMCTAAQGLRHSAVSPYPVLLCSEKGLAQKHLQVAVKKELTEIVPAAKDRERGKEKMPEKVETKAKAKAKEKALEAKPKVEVVRKEVAEVKAPEVTKVVKELKEPKVPKVPKEPKEPKVKKTIVKASRQRSKRVEDEEDDLMALVPKGWSLESFSMTWSEGMRSRAVHPRSRELVRS